MIGAIVTAVYVGLSAVLVTHTLFHAQLFFAARRGRTRPGPEPGLPQWPRVTVQLPIYNERYVVRRLLDHVIELDYPRDRLEIQILDDSTDDTTAQIAAWASAHQGLGVAIHHVRRSQRTGYKAGALQHGLATATGELVMVLDADFMPHPSLLRDLVPHFADPSVAVAQARWSHANRAQSWLTRLQGSFIDFHFSIEQVGRNQLNCFVNFNGTAGMWRVAAIRDAGGWRADTLTEDLDLSYRAQLRGWRFVVCHNVTAPAELPADIRAFRGQQHRWMKGVAQNARLLLPAVWRAPLPLRIKAHAAVQLLETTLFGVLLALLVLSPIAAVAVAHHRCSAWTMANPLLLVSVALSPVYFIHRTSTDAGSVLRRFCDWQLMLAVSTGLALHNTIAVISGLRGESGEFVRTPKAGDGPAIAAGAYRVRGRQRVVLAEVFLWGYLVAGLIYGVATGHGYLMWFPALAVIGLTAMAVAALLSTARTGWSRELGDAPTTTTVEEVS